MQQYYFSASGSGSGNFLLGNAYSNVLLHANDCSEQFYILYRFKNEGKDVVKDFHQFVYGVQSVLLQQCGLPILQEASQMNINSI